MKIDGRRKFTEVKLNDGTKLVIQKSNSLYFIYIQEGHQIIEYKARHVSKARAENIAYMIIERDNLQAKEQANNPDTDYIILPTLRRVVREHLEHHKPDSVTVYTSESSETYRAPYNVLEIVNELTADEIGCITTTNGLNVTLTGEYLGLLVHDLADNDISNQFVNKLEGVK